MNKLRNRSTVYFNFSACLWSTA